jgi:hypothetical protein
MTNKTEIYKAYYERNKDKADFKDKKSERNKRYYERKKQLKQLKPVNDKILVVKLDNIKTSNIEDTQKLDEAEIAEQEITEQDKKVIVKVLDKIKEIEMGQISNKIDEELSLNNDLLDSELCEIEILAEFIKKIPRFSILNPDISKRVILTKSAILLNKNKYKTRKTTKNGNYLRNFIVKAG